MTSTPSALLGFSCLRCDAEYQHGHYPHGCPRCRDQRPSALRARYDHAAIRGRLSRGDGPGVWAYAALLPVRDSDARISLQEGSTPLLGPYRLEHGRRLWIKNESVNPTWSYKDRLAAVGVSAAREAGARVVASSSTGNHGAAVTAYSSAAGLGSVVVTRHDTNRTTAALVEVLGGRLLRAVPHQRRELLRRGVESHGWYSLSSLHMPHVGNPYALEGYKTIAYELVSQLPGRPFAVAVPTCYGEGLAGIAAGFTDLIALGQLDTMPALIAAEAAGGAPLHRARTAGHDTVGEVAPYTSIAQSIAGTSSSQRALGTLDDHGGLTAPVRDDDLLAAQRWLGRTAGVFGETAGVAGVAAVRTWDDARPLPDDVVAVMTGGGLRTADTLAGRLPAAPVVDDGHDLDELLRTVGDGSTARPDGPRHEGQEARG